MEDPLQPTRCARLLAALAAPERLRIVRFLRDGPRNVSEVAGMLDISVVNTSHHLSVLYNAGLVCRERQGRHILYSLAPAVFQPEDEPGVPEHLNLGCCRIEIPREGASSEAVPESRR
jgi:DNA-binding transcriptional ArsR family regulator